MCGSVTSVAVKILPGFICRIMTLHLRWHLSWKTRLCFELPGHLKIHLVPGERSREGISRPRCWGMALSCIVFSLSWYGWCAHRERESRRPSWTCRLISRVKLWGLLYRWIKAVHGGASQNPIRVRELRIDPLAKKPDSVMKKSWNHLWGNSTGAVTNQLSWHFYQNSHFHLYLFLRVETLTDSDVINCLRWVIEWLINRSERFLTSDNGIMG